MRFSKEIKVGLFATLSIVILYFGFNYLKGMEFLETTSSYYAKYSNVGGLTVSNPVSISGFSVGRVKSVQIMQNDSNKVMVEFAIRGDIILGEGARAVLDVGLLGETQITIEPGNIYKPLVDGDTIDSELGQGLSELFSTLAEPVAQNLTSTIIRVNNILDKLGGSSEKINNMVENLEKTTFSVRYMAAETRANLNEITQGYKGTVDNINRKIDELSPILLKYSQLADSLKTIEVQPTFDAATKVMYDIDSLVNTIKESDGTLMKLIENDSLYNNLNITIQSLDSLLIHFRSRPKDFFSPLGRDKPKGIRE